MSVSTFQNQLLEAAAQFATGANILNALPVENGHINDTFLLQPEFAHQPKYVLQQINRKVFPDVEKLMENILSVTLHLKSALATTKSPKPFLEVVPTINGLNYYCDPEGNCWRCFNYIPNRPPAPEAINASFAHEGGRALGEFQRMLSDLPKAKLHDTIPNFHNISKRYSSFENAVKNAPGDRIDKAVAEITFFKNTISSLAGFDKNKDLPLRITHNDTKFNNILFDDQAKALCFIDLDTVMHGYVLYDFGDAIRTLANSSKEDESNAEKIEFRFDLFAGFAEGYLESTHGMLIPAERELLAFSTKLMTFIIGLRFLTDYLESDGYYKTDYPDHNLVRARNQIIFFSKLDEHLERMQRFIEKYHST